MSIPYAAFVKLCTALALVLGVRGRERRRHHSGERLLYEYEYDHVHAHGTQQWAPASADNGGDIFVPFFAARADREFNGRGEMMQRVLRGHGEFLSKALLPYRRAALELDAAIAASASATLWLSSATL